MNLETNYPTLKTRLFPNGDFTIGYCPPKSKRDGAVGAEDQHYEDSLRWQEDRAIGRMDAKVSDRWKHFNADKPERPKKPRSRRGLNGISGEGRRKLRSGCYLLQQRYGRSRLGFLTLTLPSADWITDVWASEFSEILRQVVQELRRELAREGAPTNILGAIELQTGRYAKTGQIAPHIHMVYVAKRTRRKGDFYLSARRIRAIYTRILKAIARKYCENFGEIEGEIIWSRCVNAQIVKKSVEAYLSKYLSKGSGTLQPMIEAGFTDLIPTAWYTISKTLLKTVMSCVHALSDNCIHAVINDCMDEFPPLAYMKKLELPISPEVTLTGYVGRVKMSEYYQWV